MLALVVAVAIGVVTMVGSGEDRTGGSDPSEPAGAAASTAAGDAATGNGIDTTGVSSETAPAVPPPGWVSYVDPTGWSVAYPAGWTRLPGRAGPGNVDFVEPATGTFLRIGSIEKAHTSALADWRAHEADFRKQAREYRRVRLEPTDGAGGRTQADWEFTYRSAGGTDHVLDRGAVRNGHGYALYWHIRDDRWTTDLPLMRKMFATFRPAP
jgi:hypothetical protein